MGGSESRNQTSSSSTRAYSNASEIRYQGSGRSIITPTWNKSGLGDYFNITLYHGTDIKSALLILKEKKFKPSKKGNLGPGIYFTDDKQKASAIGKDRARQRGVPGSVVIVCKIQCYEKYCRKGRHGKWEGVCDAFIEYCYQDGQGNLEIQEAEFDEVGKKIVTIAVLQKVVTDLMVLKELIELKQNMQRLQKALK